MSAEAKLPPTMEITFTDDWSVVSSGQLYPGCSLVIRYDTRRLVPDTPATASASGDFYAELAFRKKGRPITQRLTPSNGAPTLLSANVDIPVYCREFIIWFKVCKEAEQWAYDSNSGANYSFPVRGNAIMAFPVNEEVKTRGYLTPGGTLRICYDSRRLPGRDFYLGNPAWDIQAAVKFTESGQDTRKLMQPTGDDVDPVMISDFEIPTDADFVSIWFKHWGHFSGDTYDSNWGRNYVWSFQYDGEIWFSEDMKAVRKGFLLAGSKVCVWYDTNRIFNEEASIVSEGVNGICDEGEKCKSTKWLKAHVMFNGGGDVIEKDLGEVQKDNCIKAVFEIPVDACEIILWFTYGDLKTVNVPSFDSCFGQNYHFEILY